MRVFVCVRESVSVCVYVCDSEICHKHPMSHPLPDQHTVETASGCTKAQEKSLGARSRLYVFRKLVTFNINTHTQPQAKTRQVSGLLLRQFCSQWLFSIVAKYTLHKTYHSNHS